MIPLCTSASLPLPSECGCAFSSDGLPCVAQRVWPMPHRAAPSAPSSSVRSSSDKRPTLRRIETAPPSAVATPQLS
jgi:hypothetical protein